ncbi:MULTISPECIES: restriction endonuclease [unclassified Lysobacter]|uniref:restriction endonuclease n=1 Tax=unclassified Lysobacter TaxID=2635362 RepID=UPI001BE6DBEC|nr:MULTISPECIES: restriction endonuclease [unclassified Lysobacter]MBT2746856.1 restriction endonuclease [Lysobacter sp. ISL-42]MBT2750659.1 restriction endonuclease [Lysobacter sp. ISL-50]MBT2779488.1 restriction endonuclease [Lysobacter sp. ISL-54]MBT2784677.1 restriction endonuclease [Lysobacter sp. ISL-52]
MSSFSLWAAAAVTLTIGLASTAYLWSYRRHRTEVSTGIAGLAKMRWREFARLIVEALRERGFEAESVEESLARGTQAELRLLRAGKPWLLSCKLGDADYKVSAATVAELADAVRFNGAAGGLLVTTGRFDGHSERVADGLDLYSGETLWELVEPLLPASTRHEVIAAAQKRSIQTIVAAWAGAIVLGLIVGFVVPHLIPHAAPAALPATETAAARDGGDVVPVPADAPPAAVMPPEGPAPADDAAADDQASDVQPAVAARPAAAAPAVSGASANPAADRAFVIRAIAGLNGVERALWSTPSNLLIYRLTDAGKQDIDNICQVLDRYPELRSSRVQLQPPPGSTTRVRFFQCRAY